MLLVKSEASYGIQMTTQEFPIAYPFHIGEAFFYTSEDVFLC